MSAPFDMDALPEPLRHGLLLGGVGRVHLAGQAQAALADPAQVRLGLDLLLAAWEAAPLDGALAGTILGLDARVRFVPPPLRPCIEALARRWRPARQEADRLAALAGARKHDKLLAWLLDGLRGRPDTLFWRRHALDLALFLGDRQAQDQALDGPWPPELEPVQTRLAGDVAFQRGDFDQAACLYARSLALRPGAERLARCLWTGGKHERATELWRGALARAPWNVNLLLCVHDALSGLDRPAAPLEDVTVCLYSFNNARELDATLAALLAGPLDGVRVLALDNGSTDHTGQVLEAWTGRAPQALEAIRLPVNVGAPAARNWLLEHPKVREAAYVAFLDDDAIPPASWRGLFGQAVRAQPRAGVWGCKVADQACPARIQHADINPVAGAAGQAPPPGLADLCGQDLDYGQFDYIRPCLSVTGCFHLLRTDRLAGDGGFDIRFSPSQYDDLDRDLRRARAGGHAVYQGHLRVLHARLSGALLNVSAQATGVSQGNLLKLAAKHPPEAMDALRAATHRLLLEDWRTKRARLNGSSR